MTIEITEIDAAELSARLERFTDILIQSVDAGAAISFMAPLAREDAAEFWLQSVRPEVEAGRRILLGAKKGDALLGTVQLVTAMPPNQFHRAEISKMIVHPEARRMGIGRALMTAALEHARSLGKPLSRSIRARAMSRSLYMPQSAFKWQGLSPISLGMQMAKPSTPPPICSARSESGAANTLGPPLP